MRTSTRIQGVIDSATYWAKWTLLNLYGPAIQRPEGDPIEKLKREYGRPPAP